MVESLKPSCRRLHLKLNRILQVPDLYASDVDPRYDANPRYQADLARFTAELIKLNSNPVAMMNRNSLDSDCTYVEAVARRVDEWNRRYPQDKNGLIGSLSQALDDTNGKERPYPASYEFLHTRASPAPM